MGDSRSRAALERIERAIARIEAMSGDLGPAEGRSPHEAEQALRGTVEKAISRLDRLLGETEAR